MEERLALTRRAAATHFWFRGFRGFVIPAVEAVAAGRRDLRILDCGCGTGDNLPWLSTFGRASGVDLSAGGAAATHDLGFRAARADITRLPFATGTFDLATSFDVLQCVPDDAGAVAEMARVLKPGGAVVLTVAALEALRGDHAEVWEEFQRYTRRSARALVTAAGLVPERVDYLFASLFPLMVTTRTLQRLTRRFRTLDPDSDIRVPSAPVNGALTWLVAREAAVAQRLPMPIGSSLLIVARKPRQGR